MQQLALPRETKNAEDACGPTGDTRVGDLSVDEEENVFRQPLAPATDIAASSQDDMCGVIYIPCDLMLFDVHHHRDLLQIHNDKMREASKDSAGKSLASERSIWR
jgi:hypothetical protein